MPSKQSEGWMKFIIRQGFGLVEAERIHDHYLIHDGEGGVVAVVDCDAFEAMYEACEQDAEQ